MRYRPSIDGMRALAVLPVIVFHLGLGWLNGGYLGVDVFFVISGYLMASILLADIEAGRFSAWRFWGRRVRRIFPALIVLVWGYVAAYAAGLIFTDDLAYIAGQGMSSLLSYSNFYFFLSRMDYWAADVNSQPLIHTWSLSLEEQFYLLLPFVLFAAYWLGRRAMFAAVAALVAVSLWLYLAGAAVTPDKAFYMLPSRAWELGAGCLVALAGRHAVAPAVERAASLAVLAGWLGVAALYIWGPDFEGLGALLALPIVVVAGTIALSGQPESLVTRMLAQPALVLVGKISYSLYLWHWLVIYVFRQYNAAEFGLLDSVAAVAITFVLAYLSWRFVENPVRRRPQSTGRVVLVTVATVVGCAGLGRIALDPATPGFAPTVWAGDNYNIAAGTTATLRGELRLTGVTTLRDDLPAPGAYATGGKVVAHGAGPPEIVFLGDSHALMWAGLVDRIATGLGATVSFQTAQGTFPFFVIPPVRANGGTPYFNADEKLAFDRGVLGSIARWKPAVVLLSTRWSLYQTDRSMRDLMAFLDASGPRVILLSQPPELFFGDRSAPRFLQFLGLGPAPDGGGLYLRSPERPEYVRGEEILHEVARACRNCEVVDIGAIFRRGDEALVAMGDRVLYVDDDHLSRAGAMLAREPIEAAIRRALTAARARAGG